MNAAAYLLKTMVLCVTAVTVGDHDTGVELDDAIQARIAEVAGAVDRVARCGSIEHLRVVVRGDSGLLVAQLLYYAALHGDGAPVVGRILHDLEVPPVAAVAVAADHLEHGSFAVRGMAREVLRHFEDRSPARPPDFSAYRAVIEAGVRRGQPLAESLVRVMYDSDPGAAVLALMRGLQLRDTAELREILWAEHVVSELLWRRRVGFATRDEVTPAALAELSRLAAHQRWWVRLYVVEIYRKYPELRDSVTLERLSRDDHAVIREIVTAFDAGR